MQFRYFLLGVVHGHPAWEYHRGMRQSRLPDGFGVRIDPRVRSYSGGRFLIGGSPARMVELAPDAAALIGDGFFEVCDTRTAQVARRLLDSGIANPRPRLLPAMNDVTIVVPVRNNESGLARLIRALRGHQVIVVDDGSDHPVRLPEQLPGGCRVAVIRHEASQGPAAARNAGLRAATTEFVALLDPDVVPRSGWLEVMLGHFSDPAVALVAPRIVALDDGDRPASALDRYEHSRSQLDLGRREGAVQARGDITCVPAAAILVRRAVILSEGGFDESSAAADAELCWKLERAHWWLRYEPAAHVAADHQVSVRKWFARLMAHGTRAAQAAGPPGGRQARLTISPWTVVAAVLLATASKLGLAGVLVTAATALLKLRHTFRGLDRPTQVAAIYMARGFAAGLWQLASALCRNYWPVTLLAILCSRQIRRLMLAMALAEGLADWLRHRESGGLDPLRYLVFKRLDDIAYGSGLWHGAVRKGDFTVLRPVLSR